MNRGFFPIHAFIFFTLLSFLLLVSFPRPAASAAAQEVSPHGTIQELSIDDGTADCAAGTTTEVNGKSFGWANKLTPSSYPATLRSITIGFNRNLIGQEVRQDALYRIVVYADPEQDGPSENQEPIATFTGRVRGTDELMTFNLVSPVTITSGSFVIGAIDDFGFGSLPALFDIPGKSNPPGSDSYITFDGGGTWRTQADAFGDSPGCLGPGKSSAGSWLIRATVETNPVAVPTVTKIKDPAAVEPWGVAVNRSSGETFVTNYVSDNVTVVLSTNSIQNVSVGDGTGGTPDGPYGVVVDPSGNKVYVTLFGSNTIPSKEFPVDYSTVSNGRVAVLTRQANNSFAQTNQITVGKGPKFPAVVQINSSVKLYVPCGGANRVDVINTATNSKIREIAVGTDPSSCAASLDGSKLYVTNSGDGTISVIDTRTDTKIKDILIPPTTPAAPGLPPLPALKNPVSAVVSTSNGNLYVTYNGAADSPNGAIVEFNTCSDTLARVIIDPSTTGTPAGAAGATGIAAPTSALLRDAMTGTTPNAGGGGGGPFGIAAPTLTNKALVFTNDGLGIIAMLDTRTDQVVTAPPIIVDDSPKPRGIACRSLPTPAGCAPPCVPPEVGFTAYVALGQPDNSVAIITFLALPGDIPDVPVINSVDIGKKVIVHGSGFVNGTHVEVSDPETGVCLTFNGKTRVHFGGDQIIQKGTFSDGRSIKSVLKSAPVVTIRVVNPDGVSRVFVKQQ